MSRRTWIFVDDLWIPLHRDWLVGNATAQSTDINTTTLTNTSTISGQTSYGGYTYHTNVQYVSGLLSNTSIGINHNATVAVGGANAADGLVAVLGVTITERPQSSSSCVYSPLSPYVLWAYSNAFVPILQCHMDCLITTHMAGSCRSFASGFVCLSPSIFIDIPYHHQWSRFLHSLSHYQTDFYIHKPLFQMFNQALMIPCTTCTS